MALFQKGGRGEAFDASPLERLEGLPPPWFLIVDRLNMPLFIAELSSFSFIIAGSMPYL